MIDRICALIGAYAGRDLELTRYYLIRAAGHALDYEKTGMKHDLICCKAELGNAQISVPSIHMATAHEQMQPIINDIDAELSARKAA